MNSEIIEGYSNSSLERILGLPFGYLKDKRHYRAKDFQALIKILKTFPWMLIVADANYDEKIAKREMVKAAIDMGLLEKKI